ncbi:integrase [Streptomyces sp. H27-H1]|uniref:integrase n=1 Tax=Streptomyces sp. H27-H1 TaxID=2996461 RepID=UPI00226EEEDE|nr:integrase [Streptomyces sp. H27-H1]MCY0928372.1 integrase [Streptomyces sp. H27-H1]
MKWWTGEYYASGRKRFESEGGFTDEDEAFKHGQKQLHEIREGTHVSKQDGATSVADWSDTWLASLDLGHLSIRNYRSAIKIHIKPYFEGKTVGQLTILDFRAFRKTVKAKVKEKHARQVVGVFSLIMADAVKTGLRKDSPVETLSRRGKYEAKPKERKRDIPVEVVHQLASNAQLRWGDAGHVFFWTMAMTGMRPGELFGLTREHCYPAWPASDPRTDADSADERADDLLRYGRGPERMPAIRVQRQIQYEESELRFFPPKYESYRTLVIPDFLAEALDLLLASHDSKWVFPSIEGSCLASVSFDREYWRPIADGSPANVSPWAKRPRPETPAVPSFVGRRMYLLRHGHKAMLDEEGVHSRYTVETRMGHEMQGVEATYSSVTVPMEQMLRKTLQARWAGLALPTWRPGQALPPEFAQRPSVASLVRAVVGEHGRDADVLALVQAQRSDVKAATVKRTLGRVLAESS